MALYFLFRIKQLYRLLKKTGIIFFICFVALLCAMFSGSILKFSNLHFTTLCAFALTYLLSIHFYRKDLGFLRNVFPTNFKLRLVIFLECLVLLFPILLLMMITARWVTAFFVLLTSLIAFVLPMKFEWNYKKANFKLAMIPKHLFELKSCIRQYRFAPLLFIILSILTYLHISIYILSCLILAALVIHSFSFYEGKELINIKNDFLLNKIGINTLALLLLILPYHSIALFSYPEYYLVVIYGSCSIMVLLWVSILYKYSQYHPLKMQKISGGFQSVILVFFLMPGLILANIIMIPFLWLKANANLMRYA